MVLIVVFSLLLFTSSFHLFTISYFSFRFLLRIFGWHCSLLIGLIGNAFFGVGWGRCFYLLGERVAAVRVSE